MAENGKSNVIPMRRKRSEKRRRTALKGVRLTPEEERVITNAAALEGVSVGQFMRDAAMVRSGEIMGVIYDSMRRNRASC